MVHIVNTQSNYRHRPAVDPSSAETYIKCNRMSAMQKDTRNTTSCSYTWDRKELTNTTCNIHLIIMPRCSLCAMARTDKQENENCNQNYQKCIQ